jgi:hypothetical protein
MQLNHKAILPELPASDERSLEYAAKPQARAQRVGLPAKYVPSIK